MTPDNDERLSGAFVAGDMVTDGVWIAPVVVDIDAGTAVLPFIAQNWAYFEKGVMIDTAEAGLVYYDDRTCLSRV